METVHINDANNEQLVNHIKYLELFITEVTLQRDQLANDVANLRIALKLKDLEK